MDPRTTTLLQNLVKKEGRSLLQYIGEAFPWTTVKNHHGLPIVLQIVKEEQDATADIVKLLTRRKVRAPYLGAYPMQFTTLNYVALDHLLPLLIAFERGRLSELESQLPLVADAEAHALVRELIDSKRRHAHTLETLSSTDKQTRP